MREIDNDNLRIVCSYKQKLVSSNEIRQYYIEIGERTIVFGLNANATNGHKYNKYIIKRKLSVRTVATNVNTSSSFTKDNTKCN